MREDIWTNILHSPIRGLLQQEETTATLHLGILMEKITMGNSLGQAANLTTEDQREITIEGTGRSQEEVDPSTDRSHITRFTVPSQLLLVSYNHGNWASPEVIIFTCIMYIYFKNFVAAYKSYG
ncbi:unnamed protein product [Arabis nemorensis]|uniref:Uncharacterized protein n=1 Tax=Arabis nemorensis TaxID=586526 RepID=A0A565BWK2_9BRAS|nr:unnamed protein product [Arabis nemorensis]